MMKKLLFSVLIAASVVSVSCMKRVEGILREEPAEISKKEAVKIRSYYEEQLATAEALLNDGKTAELEAYLKGPDWALAERCHSKLTQLPPELATEMNIAGLEMNFVAFVNKVIEKGIPLREVEEE
ncbi:hypothetical protein [Duncaniella muris]|uniref:hypothetical protein n=1 Tax=Duncaniella muris TaxID=2094150 RepID=UPI002714C704|nr:hypothetical protein [Duncaniella muris]